MNQSVLVVGDSMLDRYWDGRVERISPEAPVPVLRMGREWQRAGGAANVAVNVASLGCAVELATLLGDDDAGQRLAAVLHERGVRLHAVHREGLVTTQKIRAVCRRQQLLRVDVEEDVPGDSARALADLVFDLLPAHRLVLLSDYDKGALRHGDAMVRRVAAQGGRVLVDPKSTADFTRYRGAWLVKPNEAEARAAGGAWSDDAGFERRMTHLREQLDLEHLLVTRGEQGMALFSRDRATLHVRAEQREVFDVSGAGDTVLAALAAALCAGRTLDDAVRYANRAAGIVVGKFGTASVTPAEVGEDAMDVAAT